MAATFAFAESRAGAPRKVAFEAVTAARQAADASGGGEVHALLIGAPGIPGGAEELGRYGADVVTTGEHPQLERYNPEVLAATAEARLRVGGYRAAFFAASAQGRDLAPRVAARLGVSLASDVTDFEVRDDAVLARHPGYTGKVIVTLRLTRTPHNCSTHGDPASRVPARTSTRRRSRDTRCAWCCRQPGSRRPPR